MKMPMPALGRCPECHIRLVLTEGNKVSMHFAPGGGMGTGWDKCPGIDRVVEPEREAEKVGNR